MMCAITHTIRAYSCTRISTGRYSEKLYHAMYMAMAGGYLLMCRKLGTVDVKPTANALWTLKCIRPHQIVRVYILHNLLLVVMEHVMERTQGFLQKH